MNSMKWPAFQAARTRYWREAMGEAYDAERVTGWISEEWQAHKNGAELDELDDAARSRILADGASERRDEGVAPQLVAASMGFALSEAQLWEIAEGIIAALELGALREGEKARALAHQAKERAMGRRSRDAELGEALADAITHVLVVRGYTRADWTALAPRALYLAFRARTNPKQGGK